MMLDDVDQNGNQKFERRAIVTARNIARQRVKVPQRCVGSMVHAFLCALRKHVWNQTITDVMSECAQDVTRLNDPAGGQCKSLKTDHRVTSPVSEPVISGDYGANFIAGSMRARCFLKPAGGRDDKLIGCE